MAERRMFAKSIINSARFLRMPVSSRLLYYDLGMQADDDGVVEAFAVMRMTGAREDDLRVLVTKNFVTLLDEGELVAYINDWTTSNSIRSDRKIDSVYQSLLLKVVPDAPIVTKTIRADTKKKARQPLDVQWTTNGQPMDSPWTAEDRIGKDRLVEESIVEDSVDTVATDVAPNRPKRKVFVKPTIEEVRAYCDERHNSVNPEAFIDHYNSNGWKVGRNSMKDWKAAVRTWERNNYGNNSKQPAKPKSSCAYGDHEFDGIDGFC